jgi:hypothetical protein
MKMMRRNIKTDQTGRPAARSPDRGKTASILYIILGKSARDREAYSGKKRKKDSSFFR